MRHGAKLNYSSLALKAYFLVALVYLLLPMLVIIPMSFSETRYLKFPPSGFTLDWYREFFTTQGWLDAAGRSLMIATISAVIATIIGTLASLAISSGKPWERLTRTVFLGPQLVPVVIVGLGALLVFSRFNLNGSILAISTVHAILALPFVVTTVTGALRQTGGTLTRAARVMGAKPYQAFYYVTLPMIRPGVITGAIFAFFISFDELVIALFVMGQTETLPMRIWADMRQDLTPVVAAVATLLIFATVLAVVIADSYRRRVDRLQLPKGNPPE